MIRRESFGDIDRENSRRKYGVVISECCEVIRGGSLLATGWIDFLGLCDE